jgi:hypothetical protein
MEGGPPKEWQEMIMPYAQEMETSKGLCHVVEWIREEMPLETKEGGVVMKECQSLIDEIYRPQPPTREHLEKPGKTEQQVQLPMPDSPPRENVIVFEDSHGFTKAVIDNAPEGRIGSKKIVSRPWGQYEMEDIQNIIGPKGCSTIIFGATCDTPKSNSVDDIIEFQTTVMRLAFYVVKCIIVNEIPVKKLCFLSRGQFEENRQLHEEVGLSLTTFTTLFGFSNTARLELEDTDVQLIDTEYFLKPPFWQTADFNLPQRLAAEVWRNETFGRNHVRVLNKGRYVARIMLASRYAEAACKEFQLPDAGHVVGISGGNGSLGIVMANWLVDKAAEEGKGNFTIQMLSRSCKITDDNMPHYKRVDEKAKKLGITYEHKQCNLSNQQAADEYVLSTNGKLFGFIHSAGVLADQMCTNLQWEGFEKVWSPKHRAALYLHDAFERLPTSLSFFWMFSSSSVYGNMGQLNYSSSNSGQDGLARHRFAVGKPGQTMQWGGWGEVGMASNMDAGSKRRMEMGPMPMFTNLQGITGMEIGLKTNIPGFSVYRVNAQAMFGMTMGDANVNQNYSRNIFSEFVPPPPVPLDFDHSYSFYRQVLFPQAFRQGGEMLTWQSYVAPMVETEDYTLYDETSPGFCTKFLDNGYSRPARTN